MSSVFFCESEAFDSDSQWATENVKCLQFQLLIRIDMFLVTL